MKYAWRSRHTPDQVLFDSRTLHGKVQDNHTKLRIQNYIMPNTRTKEHFCIRARSQMQRQQDPCAGTPASVSCRKIEGPDYDLISACSQTFWSHQHQRYCIFAYPISTMLLPDPRFHTTSGITLRNFGVQIFSLYLCEFLLLVRERDIMQSQKQQFDIYENIKDEFKNKNYSRSSPCDHGSHMQH